MVSVSVTAPGAVRITDRFIPSPCMGFGWVAIGYSPVQINGLSAVRLGDSAVGGFVLGGSVVTGSSTVLIGGKPAARLSDMVVGMCMGPLPFTGYFVLASPNVIIG